MTKSKVKAKDNSVVVIIGGVEHYALPTEIHLGNRTLGDVLDQHDKINADLQSLIKQHQGLTLQFEKFKDFITDKIIQENNDLKNKIDAFDIKLLNVVKGVISK